MDPYQTSASQIQGEAAMQTAQPIDAYLRGRLSKTSIDDAGKEPTLAAHIRKKRSALHAIGELEAVAPTGIGMACAVFDRHARHLRPSSDTG